MDSEITPPALDEKTCFVHAGTLSTQVGHGHRGFGRGRSPPRTSRGRSSGTSMSTGLSETACPHLSEPSRIPLDCPAGRSGVVRPSQERPSGCLTPYERRRPPRLRSATLRCARSVAQVNGTTGATPPPHGQPLPGLLCHPSIPGEHRLLRPAPFTRPGHNHHCHGQRRRRAFRGLFCQRHPAPEDSSRGTRSGFRSETENGVPHREFSPARPKQPA